MNMTQAQKAQFDIDLAPKALKEEMVDRQNAEQMRLLTGMPGGMPGGLRPRAKRKNLGE